MNSKYIHLTNGTLVLKIRVNLQMNRMKDRKRERANRRI